jgi:hypothetical protein
MPVPYTPHPKNQEGRRMGRRGPVALAAPALLLIALVVAHTMSGPSSPRAVGGGPPGTATAPARVLTLRAADPGGGAPWGMRVVATPSGLLCAQVARLKNGTLGQLGLDGAFKDDGRFHPLPQGQFAEVTVPGTVGEDADCVATKETFSATIDGLDRNAVGNPQHSTIPLGDRREIAYGLLGPHARAVMYKDGKRTVTRAVLRGLGAFLVVRTARQRRYLGRTGAAPGGDYSDDLQPAGPTGFIEAITYRYGKTVCRDNGTNTIARCHLAGHPLGNERTPSQGGG